MTPAEFVHTYGPLADRASARTGINRWAILAQWADETGWGTSYLCTHDANLAGIECTGRYACDGGFSKYPLLDIFINDYVLVLSFPEYAGIRNTPNTDVIATCKAFGESPWAGGHYSGGGYPGADLVGIWEHYLQPLATPAPTPTPTEDLSVSDRDYLYGELVKVAAAANVALDPAPWAAPTPAPAPSPSPAPHTYTVVEGDTLWGIANHFYGDGSKDMLIYHANEAVIGGDPNLIRPGMVLTIPAA